MSEKVYAGLPLIYVEGVVVESVFINLLYLQNSAQLNSRNVSSKALEI